MNKNNTMTGMLKSVVKNPQFSSLFILAVMLIAVIILQDNFFTLGNWVRSLNTFVPAILLAMGQAVVIISGGLDLSNGTALSLLTCIMAKAMSSDSPETGIYAIVLAAGAAVVIGIINGIGVGYLRLSPIIVTFATSYMWLGLSLFIMPTPGGQAVPWFKNFYKFQLPAGVQKGTLTFGDIIPPAFILLLIGCVVWYVISKTRTGRYIYAVGGNDESAFTSGINTAKVQTKAFIINSFFILLAAIFFVGQNQAGDARMGSPMTLISVAAAIIGGIAITGGRGSVYFGIVGSLTLSLVGKVIFFTDLPNEYQTFVNGIIIILAIALSMVYSVASARAALKGDK